MKRIVPLKTKDPEMTTAASLLSAIVEGLECGGQRTSSQNIDDAASGNVMCDGALWRIEVKRLDTANGDGDTQAMK